MKKVFIFLFVCLLKLMPAQVSILIDSKTLNLSNFKTIGSVPAGQKLDNVIFARKGAQFYKRVFNGVVSPDWWGAVVNDGKDDTPFIQLAVDYLARNGGGVVEFSTGSYDVSHVDLKGAQYSNIDLRGNKTKIKSFPAVGGDWTRYGYNDGLVNITNSQSVPAGDFIKNVKITGFEFITDSSTSIADFDHHQILIAGALGVVIENCVFDGFMGSGVSVNDNFPGFSQSANIFIKNSVFKSSAGKSYAGVLIKSGVVGVVEGCTFQNIAFDHTEPSDTTAYNGGGVVFEHVKDDIEIKNWVVRDNIFSGIGGDGAISLHLTNFAKNDNNTGIIIENNNIKNSYSALGGYSYYEDYQEVKSGGGKGSDEADFVSFRYEERVFRGFVKFRNNNINDVVRFIDANLVGIDVIDNTFKKSQLATLIKGGVNWRIIGNRFSDNLESEGLRFVGFLDKLVIEDNNFSAFASYVLYFSHMKNIQSIKNNSFGNDAVYRNGKALEFSYDPYLMTGLVDLSTNVFVNYSDNKDFHFLNSVQPTDQNILPKQIINKAVFQVDYLVFDGVGYYGKIYNDVRAGYSEQIFVQDTNYNPVILRRVGRGDWWGSWIVTNDFNYN